MKAQCAAFFHTLQVQTKLFFKSVFDVEKYENYSCMNDKFKRAPRTVPPSARNKNIFDLTKR